MLVLGLDFETTGLNTSQDKIIEIGAVLWDTVRGTPLVCLNELLWCEDIWDNATNPKEKIEQITKIKYEDLINYGIHPCEGFEKLNQLMRTPDLVAVVAHNGDEFDKPILFNEHNAKRWGVELPDLPWIDTQYDIPYGPEIPTRKLSYVATEHGLINPFPHRALFDVLTMLKIAQNYDVDWMVKISKTPFVRLIALTEFHQNDDVKAKGFIFQSSIKKWVRKIRECQLQSVKSSLGFDVKEVR